MPMVEMLYHRCLIHWTPLCPVPCPRSIRLSRALNSARSAMKSLAEPLFLASKNLSPNSSVASLFLVSMTARSSPFVLVLDDYQTIVAPDVHEAVRFWLDRQPPQVHLAILSRQDPPFAISQLRGRGHRLKALPTDLASLRRPPPAVLSPARSSGTTCGTIPLT